MKKVKILYLLTSLTAGGTELMLQKIILRMDKNKFEIILCSLLNITDILNSIKNEVKRYYILHFDKIFNFFSEFWKLRQIIKKEKPDILHCFLPHSNIIGRFAAIGSSCKVICSIRAKQLEKKYFLPLDRFTQKLVNVYTVNSKSLAQFEIVQKIDNFKIVLIENGINFEKFKITNNPINLKKELNLGNSIIISMVAHLRKQKDYPTALRAIKYLQK